MVRSTLRVDILPLGDKQATDVSAVHLDAKQLLSPTEERPLTSSKPNEEPKQVSKWYPVVAELTICVPHKHGASKLKIDVIVPTVLPRDTATLLLAPIPWCSTHEMLVADCHRVGYNADTDSRDIEE